MATYNLYMTDDDVRLNDFSNLPTDFYDEIKKFPEQSKALANYLRIHVSEAELFQFAKIDKSSWEKIFKAIQDDTSASLEGAILTCSDRCKKIVETILASIEVAADLALAIIALLVTAGVVVLTSGALLVICIILAVLAAGAALVLALIAIWG